MTNSKEGTGEPCKACKGAKTVTTLRPGIPGSVTYDRRMLMTCPRCQGTGAEPETDAVAAKKCWYCGLYIDLGQPGPCALSQSGFHYTRDVSSPAAAEALEGGERVSKESEQRLEAIRERMESATDSETFIASAQQDIPWLIDQLASAQAEIERLKAKPTRGCDCCVCGCENCRNCG